MHPRLPALGALASLVALAAAPALAQNWVRQYPATFPDLLDVAKGAGGLVIAVGNDGVVLRSTNSGVTWSRNQAPSGRLATVAFQGSTVLAGGDGLFRSTDGGLTFALTHPATGVQSIETVGATNAWAVTSDGFVLRSTDGGASWSLTTLPSGWYGSAHDVSFESPLLGWIVGTNGQMLATSDGGNTWQPIASPTNWTLYGAQRTSAPIDFILEDSGTYRGTTGGWTYTFFPWVTAARDFEVQGSFGVVVGLAGRIMVSPDNGVNWIFAHDDNGYEHEGVVILDSVTAIVVGEDGRVLRTTDAGGTWTVVYGTSPASSPWIRGMCAVSDDVVLAACTGGKVLRTTNGGTSWSEQQAGSSQTNFRDVDSIDGVHAYAIGSRQGFYPTFAYTHDGGVTWNEINQLGMYDHWDVEAIGPDTAFVGSDTRIWSTTNGGVSWGYVVPMPYATYHAIDFVTPALGFAAGTAITRTTDGGQTWTWLYDPPSRIRGLTFFDADLGFAVGDGGMILVTTDGGATWLPRQSGTTAQLTSVTIAENGTLFAAGYSGTVLTSGDGGATWSPFAPPGLSSDPIHSIVSSTQRLWMGGDADAGIWRLQSSLGSCLVESYCTGKVHSGGGIATMAAFGNPRIVNNVIGVGVLNCLPHTQGIGFRSEVGAASLPLWGGTLCVQAPLARMSLLTFDANGFAYYSIAMDPSMIGDSHWYQVIFRDTQALDGTGIGMTDGLRLRFCP